MSNLGTLDTFSGTFKISDHSLISEVLVEYLFEKFYDRIDSKWLGRTNILSTISLEDINAELNAVWEGPGSVAKIKNLTKMSRDFRRDGLEGASSPLDNYKTPTVDDDLTQED